MAAIRAGMEAVATAEATLSAEELLQLSALGYLGGDADAPAGVVDPRDVIGVIPLTWEARRGFTVGVVSSSLYAGDVLGTSDDALYRNSYYGMSAWKQAVPNGTYDVTLKMRDTYWTAAGQRVFDISAEGKPLATGLDINVLVLDTEVYSNTGGQASKATPMGASAKFAAGGKTSRKKDLGLLAKSYGNVYVAQIAINANEIQAVRAIKEAAAYPGPSLVIAYSTCIAHGLDLANAPAHQKAAVASGHWPLYRYHPAPSGEASPLFKLDSKAPSLPLADFYAKETRYKAVGKADPALAEQLLAQAQADAEERYATYLRISEH